jgi:hypothetical protein
MIFTNALDCGSDANTLSPMGAADSLEAAKRAREEVEHVVKEEISAGISSATPDTGKPERSGKF